MRTPKEMMELIITTAREDERIRAVILNGSRANPNATPDRFQDFDIVYVVTAVKPFIKDQQWIDRFGERMILQTPDLMTGGSPRQDGGFTYLMQFMDGNRIDLILIPVERCQQLPDDSLSLLLLDKDQRFEPFPPPSEDSYLPDPPAEKAFFDCCNEFWWVSPYVAKGLARGEILVAKQMLDVVLRKQLMQMLTWLFGLRTSFSRNPGKAGKHFKEVLSPQQWEMLLATYSTAQIDPTWDALMAMSGLFRTCACEVAQAFGFTYPQQDDERVSGYLKKIRQAVSQ